MSSRVQRMILAAVVTCALAGGAHADPLNPLDYPSLGTLNTINDITVDSDALTLTVLGGPTYTGVAVAQAGGPETAVFTFSDINIGANLLASIGTARPIALLSQNDAVIEGNIFVGAQDWGWGGPGGGAGGLAGSTSGQPGEGPGGGGGAESFVHLDHPPDPCIFSIDAGGGGYGGAGGSGYVVPPPSWCPLPGPPPNGGPAYGDSFTVLQGGSGGGGGRYPEAYPSGGGGGGGIEIGAVNDLVLGAVYASGEDGYWMTGGGGGSGGGIILHAGYLDIRGSILANGGGSDYAGGGGGGRVLLETSSLYVGSGQLSTAPVSVAGGAGYEPGRGGVFDLLVGEVVVPTGETLTMIDGTPVGLLPDGWSPRIGLYRVAGTGRLVSEGATTIPALTTSGLTQVLSGTLAVDGPAGLNVLASTVEVTNVAGLSVAQHMDVGAAGTVDLLGPLTAGAAANAGQINVVGTTASFSGNVVNNATGEISAINATLGFPGDGIKNDVGLVNEGQLNLIGVVVNGDVHSPSGSAINVATEVVFNGLVSGAGHFPGAGLVTFNGGYEPGDSIAGVSFMGDVEMGAGNTLRMELGGDARGADYDAIDVAGNLGLGGALVVELIGDFHPGLGDSFDLLNWGTITGTFETLTLPDPDAGLEWDTSELYSTGQITAVPEPAALSLVALGALALIRRRGR